MAAAFQAAMAMSPSVAVEVEQEAVEAMAVDGQAHRHQGKQTAVAALPPASTPVEQALMDMIKSVHRTTDGLQAELGEMRRAASSGVGARVGHQQPKQPQQQQVRAQPSCAQMARAQAPRGIAKVHADIQGGMEYVSLANPFPLRTK